MLNNKKYELQATTLNYTFIYQLHLTTKTGGITTLCFSLDS